MGELRSDYEVILRENHPILDVRAPTEFEKGKLPNSVNEPILTDSERREVGLAYRQSGAAEAEALGFQLVSGQNRTARIARWLNFIQDHSQVVLTCWRGGQRSSIAQRWLEDGGCRIPRLAGGFKAMRQMSLGVLSAANERAWVIIAGQTGVGKTKFLQQFENSIDLEKLANHRGSSFGGLEDPQPSPVTFEIELTQCMLQKASQRPCLLEDESRTIGRLAVPSHLYDAMQTAPIVVLESDLESRLELTLDLYVNESKPMSLRRALQRIERRLGGDRYRQIYQELDLALDSQKDEDHYVWIRNLLECYYDPMYDYQLQKKNDRIAFKGDASACREFIIGTYGLKVRAASLEGQ